GGGAGHHAGGAAAGRAPGAEPRLRRDRQAGRRQDPGEDLDQRAAARMTAPTDPVPLAQALIRCPSVTPEDHGALGVVQEALDQLGFTCHRMTFEEEGTAPVENLYARLGTGSPNLCFA